MIAHNIVTTVFCSPEQEERTLAALTKLHPFNLEEEKISIKRSKAEGFDKDIIILEVVIVKDRLTKRFVNHLKEMLGASQCKLLVERANIEDDCGLYVRLDRQSLEQGKFVLTDGGSCYHIKISLAAFPKNKESAKKLAKALFEA